MFDLIIKGNLVLADRVLEDGLLTVSKEKIIGISASAAELPACREYIDATGKWVLPGGVDAHVHSGNSVEYHEGFMRSTRSAAVGGITTIIDMPYDAPKPLIDMQLLKQKINILESEAVVDVALCATLRKYGGASDVESLAEGGVCGFKLGTFETDPSRFPRIPDDQLLEIFPAVARTGLPVGFHAENEEIIKAREASFKKMQERPSPIMHCRARPPICETLEVLKLLEFAHEFSTKLHIYHLTVPRVFNLIRRFREEGVDCTAETCIHYLVLNENDMERLRAFGKINPPLRSPALQEELWRLLLSGQIDFVTSDHAPWPHAAKQDENIFNNRSGAPGVETLLPVLFSEGVRKRRMSIQLFTKLVAENPARRFRLYPRKGVLAIGSDADIIVLDPDKGWTVDGRNTQSIADWSPFDGLEVNGRVILTIVRGHKVYDGNKVIIPPGTGRYTPALPQQAVDE